ncbi:MAG: DegV family protein [Peptoniphilaceae bacterium]|nr:DegV family protein [Peptoniphilaceae bacterium]MCI6660662.1 DegV family protein [Peptoniphilaceae bacterium]MDD7434652.1 DegV family protein [Peptoniphilaceae bacterium]MDY3075853.1 DegV family protein [Peptoniphilaceae bacterium]MDY4196468.1 DegV family protein [Peptoniphilaceae bacterium]
MSYQIITDVTADIDLSLYKGLPEPIIIPMEVIMGGQTYIYGKDGTITVEEFYERLRSGEAAQTSQINPTVYTEYFRKILEEGKDVLYLCFSSGLSGTIQSAILCMEKLREEFPDRKLYCVDTLAASAGEGLFVEGVLRKQAEGLSIEEVVAWAEEHKLFMCHWFTVDSLDHLRRGGRVSAAAAFLGTALQIKPVLHVSEEGKLIPMEKARGQKKAIQSQVRHIAEGWKPELGKRVWIGHGDCMERAQELAEKVRELYADAQIDIVPIGPVIGAHAGPGVLSLFYWGSNR